jgi:acid phosphatase (class A)
MVALILTELVPERSSAILARGRAFGESRVACGVHWLSDVQAGTLNGAAILAALHSSAEFRADLQQARHEIAAAGKHAATAPASATCAVEQDAETHSLLTRPQP